MFASVHIRRIVRVTQMLTRWRRKSSRKLKIGSPPSDVPPGHVAVIVGLDSRRYIVRAKHLNHPLFRNLLKKAEDEFGFDIDGPICVPCDEASFEDVLKAVTRSDSLPSLCRGSANSLPLLRPEKSFCSHRVTELTR